MKNIMPMIVLTTQHSYILYHPAKITTPYSALSRVNSYKNLGTRLPLAYFHESIKNKCYSLINISCANTFLIGRKKLKLICTKISTVCVYLSILKIWKSINTY